MQHWSQLKVETIQGDPREKVNI